jgi:DNA-binding GntR family transcriptional regulator
LNVENDPKLRSVHNEIDIEGLDEFSAHVPLREAVARTLKRAILDGSLRPGQPISENKIANKLSVSRTPVREAVRILEAENLVTLLPGRKVIISIPTVQDVEDVYETRLIIESEALRRITPDQKELIQELEGYTRAAQQHLKRGDFIELEKVNTSLHLAILSALENRTIREFMASLHNKIARLRAYSLTDRKWAAEWEREHQQIIAHLKRGETERAVDILHHHLITPKQLLINMFFERSGSDASE